MKDDRLTVYMAGGMHDHWWVTVAELVQARGGERVERMRRDTGRPAFNMVVPALRREFCKEALEREEDEYEYTAWDLWQIRRADLVFAYHAPDDPGGQGLAAEVGYAHALGKTVIFVDAQEHKYMGLVRVMADVLVPTMQDGVDVLLTFLVGG